jgi:hypothetical protein
MIFIEVFTKRWCTFVILLSELSIGLLTLCVFEVGRLYPAKILVCELLVAAQAFVALLLISDSVFLVL